MGAEISELNTERVQVKGIGLGCRESADVLNAGNSTTLRLMLGSFPSGTLVCSNGR